MPTNCGGFLSIITIMQFNGHANKQDLVSLFISLVGSDVAINTATLYINMALEEIWTKIFNTRPAWKFNPQDNLPVGLVDITSGTKAYELPAAALVIDAAQIKDSNGVVNTLRPITQEEIEARSVGQYSEFYSNSGVPQYYELVGSKVVLHPTPNYTRAEAVAFRFLQAGVLFNPSDTTAVPKLDSIFHKDIALGAAAIYSISKTLQKGKNLDTKWEQALDRIAVHYASKMDDQPTVIDNGASHYINQML